MCVWQKIPAKDIPEMEGFEWQFYFAKHLPGKDILEMEGFEWQFCFAKYLPGKDIPGMDGSDSPCSQFTPLKPVEHSQV